jgi:hypothetical protein
LEQRVAVRLRLQDAREPDLTGGAAHVFDDDGLAEALLHSGLRGAHHDVGGAVGWKRNDDPMLKNTHSLAKSKCYMNQ